MAENIVLDFLHNYNTGERRVADLTVYQYDMGRVLEAHVPASATNVELHYWQTGDEQSAAYTPTSIAANTDDGGYTILGNIPNTCFEQSLDLHVYIVVTDDSQDVTTYEGLIRVKGRPVPDDYVDTDPDNGAVSIVSAGQEIINNLIESIPADYTALTTEVSELNERLSYTEHVLATENKTITNAYIASNGTITSGGTNVVHCFRVPAGKTVDVRSSQNIVYGLYASEPSVGSVAYGNINHTVSSTEIDDLIIPASCNWIAIRTSADGSASITPASSVIDGIETNINTVKVDLQQYNAYNLMGNKEYTGGSLNGVTFTCASDSVTVSGETTTRGSYIELYNASATLSLTAGKTYRIKHSSTNVWVVLYTYIGTALTELIRTKQDVGYTIPDTVTNGVIVRLLVSAGTSQFTETIAYPQINNAYTNADLTEIANSLRVKGILANGTDLNDVTTDGIYFINGDTAFSYSNSPLSNGTAGTLEVFSNDYTIIQRVTRYSNGNQFVRTSTTAKSFADRAWNTIAIVNNNTYNNTYESQAYTNSYEITCTPEITTDTNNYLASTGDTTDRTGDIQTMLNTTGVCHLGPGDFYVTGIELPNQGELIGSGNTTRLFLASSVTDGYAVKMLNYGTISNMMIQSQGTYTLSETVGTRHGILYQGTATSSSDPESARRYYGCLNDLYISQFSGGAITCIDTGGRINSNLVVTNVHIRQCGVGVNVVRYSEFHRFTNVSATGCYYGCICNGGNCNFVNCNFSYCRIGVLMDDSTGQSQNNSHGTFDACTICHSGANNDGIALKLLGLDSGEMFIGMQIFYGSIVIDECIGMRFVGCNFGSATPVTVTDSTVVTFDNCLMKSSSASALTQSGNTTLAFTNCYNKDGSVYNLMA